MSKTALVLKQPAPICFGVHRVGVFRTIGVVNWLMDIVGIILLINYYCKQIGINPAEPCNAREIIIIRIFAVTSTVHIAASITLNSLILKYANTLQTIHLRVFVYYHWVLCLVLFILSVIIVFEKITCAVRQEVHLCLAYVTFKTFLTFLFRRYITEMEEEAKSNSLFRYLSEKEILDFDDGDFYANPNREFLTCAERANYERYKREEFEIVMEDLDFSDSTQLGCGEYGCVFKVILKGRSDDSTVTRAVAVKTVDPLLSDVIHFKALLIEAKTLTFIGKHVNIVELIGLCTTDIRSRKLYIVSELCSFGNMQAYLRSERNTFVHEPIPDIEARQMNPNSIKMEETHKDETIKLRTMDLVKWCHEVACGMEFLESKKIIHGDLAARNVLLDESKTAKITDFGLSRRLYNYTVYVKRQSTPLPWRWLSVEAFVDMKFSSKSDIWAYGICCWEIFELGRRPWPDTPIFSMEFIQQLKDGMKMEQPKYCSKEMYERIFLPCWNNEPCERPCFSDIASYFANLLRNRNVHETNKMP